MKKYTVEVLMTVEVILDETKFTEEFMGEFASTISPYDCLDEHVEHLAWLIAADRTDGNPSNFVEGYGPLGEMGIRMRIIDTMTGIVDNDNL